MFIVSTMDAYRSYCCLHFIDFFRNIQSKNKPKKTSQNVKIILILSKKYANNAGRIVLLIYTIDCKKRVRRKKRL